MANPYRLHPDPLVTSTVEIRFTSSLDHEDILGFYSDLFREELPKIKVKEDMIPAGMKQIPDANLGHLPDFVFSNELYSVSVGRHVLSFEHLGEYQLWEKYFPFIQKQLKKIHQKQVVEAVQRVGLRYASIFPQFKKIGEAFTSKIEYNLPGYRRVNDYVRTVFQKEQTQILLQIGENVNVDQRGQGHKQGLYLDIDASQRDALPNEFSPDLAKVIDRLHQEEKELFEHLLKPEVLASLKTSA